MNTFECLVNNKIETGGGGLKEDVMMMFNMQHLFWDLVRKK